MKESAISVLSPPIPVEKRFLGRILKEIYEVKLAHDFPDRRFIVEFNDALVVAASTTIS